MWQRNSATLTRRSFFQNVDRFLNDDYVPTEQDILRARVRSTGIDEAEFDFEDFSFRYV